MQQKTTVERVLHYIGGRLRKDAAGNEVIGNIHDNPELMKGGSNEA